MPKNVLVLFDIGGVLVKLDFASFFASCAADAEVEPSIFRDKYVASGIEQAYLRGQLTTTEYYNLLRVLIQPGEPSLSLLQQRANAVWKRSIPETIALKKRVYDAGYAVGTFSNMGEVAYDHLSTNHPQVIEVYDSAHPQIYSFQIGAIKPEGKEFISQVA